MRTAEFDAFGPWVMQVVGAEGLPRLYRDHPVDFDTARMIVKVPRDIPRREANPDMDLYDHLIIADQDVLTLLSRRGEEYVTTEVPYARVAAVHTSVVMLDGLLRVHDVEGAGPDGVAVEVPYNGVSDDVVGHLARVVREQALAAAPQHPLAHPQGEPLHLGLDDLGRHDVALVSAVRELAAAEHLVVWAAHQRTTVQRRDGVLPGLTTLLLPPTLHAVIVGATPGEVNLVHRRPWVTTGHKPMHSVAHTVITVPRVDHVEVGEHPRYGGAQVVRVASGRSAIDIPCPAGAATIDALLTLLGATAP